MVHTHNKSHKEFFKKFQGITCNNQIEIFTCMNEENLATLLAKILRYHKDINVEKIVETIGGSSELQQVIIYFQFNLQKILNEYFTHYDFSKETMEEAMRMFISSVRLVGESQVIERCLNVFSKKYFKDARDFCGLKSETASITFAYSIMMLHTDLHHKILKVCVYD